MRVLQNTQEEHFDLSLCMEAGTYHHAFHPCISILQILYKAASGSKLLGIDLGPHVHVDKFTKRYKF